MPALTIRHTPSRKAVKHCPSDQTCTLVVRRGCIPLARGTYRARWSEQAVKELEAETVVDALCRANPHM